ncbi:MAG: maleylpyruvate isomerase family mycothiol-dependent enzyme, partial [Micromonosporaceae bacterium]
MTDITRAVAAERTDLAAILTGLPTAQWDAPSLCAGWRTREVVAHMTTPFRYSAPRFILEMIKARGNFNRMSDRTARRDAAALSAEQLVTTLRDNVNHPWKPPGGGLVGALSHDVIHGLDITVALGLGR